MSAAPPRLDAWVVECVQELHGTPLDAVFTTVSRLALLLPLWIGLAVVIGVRRRAPLPALGSVLVIALADGASSIAKAMIERARPPAALADVVPLVPVPASASMPSGHAAIAFAAAVALGALEARLRAPLLVLATAVAASRVWLGVHYPSDVAAGAAVGSLVALGCVALARRLATLRATSGGEPR